MSRKTRETRFNVLMVLLVLNRSIVFGQHAGSAALSVKSCGRRLQARDFLPSTSYHDPQTPP